MARIETHLLEKEIAVARTGVRRAALEVDAKDAAIETGQMQIERGFEIEIEAARVALQAARSEQARDAAALARLREEVDRERGLVRRGLVKADRLAQLEIQVAGLDEAVRTWPARIAAVEARLRSANARLNEWRAAYTREAQSAGDARLLPAREHVREREQSLDVLKTQLDGAVLRAAVASYVSVIHARPGDVISAGQPIATLVEAQPRQVVAYLDERRVASFAPGAKVIARRRGGQRARVEATVAAIGADVATLPQRLWANPHVPAWGCAIYIDLPAGAALDPGEVVDILHAGKNLRPPTLVARFVFP